MSKTTVFVVDDHHIVVDALSSYLIGNDKFEIIGSASSAAEMFKALERRQPDILVLDIKLPGVKGIQLARSVAEKYPDVKIIFLSSNTDKETINDAIKAGGVGYLSKDISAEEFITALTKISQGLTYYSSSVSQVVFDGFTENVQNTVQQLPLSQREIEIIKLFAEGYSYKEIAAQLFISSRTVEAHKRNIMEKLNLKTTVDLVKYAIKNGIVTL